MSLILSGTDGLSDVDGSAATPAIRGTDANTGMFFPAADTIAFSEGGVESMRIDASGNLGIGTASPTGKLDISTSATTNMNIIAGGSGTSAILNLLATSGGGLEAIGYAQGLRFGTITGTNAAGFTERMRIDSSGNVLIGTTSNKGVGLTVQSSSNSVWTTCTGFDQSALVVQNAGTNTGSSAELVAFQVGTSGIGTGVGKISYNGTLTVYATTSDLRVKTDNGIATETSVIDDTVIHNFTWKNGVKDRGVFAQEAYKVKPSAIQVGADDVNEHGELLKPWGVDYSVYVPDLIVYCQQLKASIQELKATVDAQAVEIAALKAK